VLAVVGLGGVAGVRWLEHRPRRLTSYQGVSLGDSKAVVEYKKGEPETVEDDPPVPQSPDYNPFRHLYTVAADQGQVNAIPNGKSLKDFNLWSYSYGLKDPSTGTKLLDIGFDKATHLVDQIECFSDEPVQNFCDLDFGIDVGLSEQKTRNILGKPTTETLVDGTKTMFFQKYDLILKLRKQIITNIYVTSLQADRH
jgi:hypothetical protein